MIRRQVLRPTILFLDRSQNDHLLLRWAIRLTDASLKIQHFTNPLLLKAYLQERKPFGNSRIHPPPAVAVLEYDPDVGSSLDLVRWIRGYRKSRALPVLMFSGSDDVTVARASYAAGASFFFRKPADFDRLQGVLQAIAQCFKARRTDFSSLHGLPEHIPFCRGAFAQPLRETV